MPNYEGCTNEADARAAKEGRMQAHFEQKGRDHDQAEIDERKRVRLDRAWKILKAKGDKPLVPDYTGVTSQVEAKWVSMDGDLSDLRALMGDDEHAAAVALSHVDGSPAPASLKVEAKAEVPWHPSHGDRRKGADLSDKSTGAILARAERALKFSKSLDEPCRTIKTLGGHFRVPEVP